MGLKVEEVARLCHEANRVYCESVGDFSQADWDKSPEWQKTSAINGVKFHLANPQATAENSHENWFKEKQEDGWQYGPAKDTIRKLHPCMLPYNQLPEKQRIKDHIFRAMVHACVATFGVGEQL